MFTLIDPGASFNILPYGVIWLATFFEGPITLLATGAGIALGQLQPMSAYLAVVLGNLTADLGWYNLGRFGKQEWLEWVTSKLGIDPGSIKRLEQNIYKYAPRLLFLSKFAIGLPIPTLIAVGLNRVPAKRWIALLVLGELIKSILFVAAGYLWANGIQQTYGYIKIVLWAVTIILVVGTAIYFKFHKKLDCPD